MTTIGPERPRMHTNTIMTARAEDNKIKWSRQIPETVEFQR